MKPLRFPTALTPPVLRRLGLADVVILCLVAGAIATVVAFAREFEAPFLQAVRIDLRPAALPRYTLYSLMRGVLALLISYLFALGFGWAAARSRAAERLLLPLLDILQSIPVLGFLPGLVLGLVALFPTRNVGLELAAILMIFTAQAWNLALSFYNSLKALPDPLRDACKVAGWPPRRTFWQLEVPGAAQGLVWNGMLSMAGGWFFLMVNEAFRLGDRDYRLPGVGSYMSVALDQGNVSAMALAILRGPRLALENPVARKLAGALLVAGIAAVAALGLWRLWLLLAQLGPPEWGQLASSAALTFARVMGAVIVSTAWALPAGVVIGRSPRLARALQPVIQVVASFPAPMLFPIVVLLFARPGVGLGVGAVAPMVLAGQWELLFHVISPVAAVPEQFKDAATVFRLSTGARWRTLYLPAAFPALVTGWVTAAGGAWNGSIVAEYIEAGGTLRVTRGLGSLISEATAHANFPLLAGGIALMSLIVVRWNRAVWRSLTVWAQTGFGAGPWRWASMPAACIVARSATPSPAPSTSWASRASRRRTRRSSRAA